MCLPWDKKGNHINLGDYGEAFALNYLKSKGMILIKQNWRCKIGEIDLIMKDRDVVVFVEVKTRKNWRYVNRSLALSLSTKKRKRLKILSQSYIRGLGKNGVGCRYRIDFIGIVVGDNRKVLDIKHYMAAI